MLCWEVRRLFRIIHLPVRQARNKKPHPMNASPLSRIQSLQWPRALSRRLSRLSGSGSAAEEGRREFLLLRGDHLLHPASGRSAEVRAGETLHPGAEALARAAADLLDDREDPDPVLLLLPSQEFIATTVTLPGVARDSIRSAVSLQASNLLPGFEEPMALAVNRRGNPDDLSDTVLWMRHRRMDDLFQAFRAEGLFLAAVMPRILAAAGERAMFLEDIDEHSITRIHWQDGVIRQWMQTDRGDLEQDAFREQWHSLLEQNGQQDLPEQSLGSIRDWQEIGPALHRPADYCFVPRGAEELRRQRQRKRRMAQLAAGMVGVAVLGALPFGLQSLEQWRLQARLEERRETASEARADQQAVAGFEQRWGVFTEFPRHDIPAVLMDLQQVVRPDVLDALEIEEGSVSIEGRSNDPQSLLQQLEQHEHFTGVDFSRATNDNRYAIEMQLTTVDFPAYFDWYFPERN